MTHLFILSLFTSTISNMILFDSKKETNLNSWVIVDDVVMGGRSAGSFHFNDVGDLVFKGDVSLKNNGGFSSIRYRFNPMYTSQYKKICIRLKGDGKAYQFRVKSSKYDSHVYRYKFQTTGDWQTIEIPFNEMQATFRGMRLNLPNFPGKLMEEVAFLISNKKEESFQLIIDKISLL